MMEFKLTSSHWTDKEIHFEEMIKEGWFPKSIACTGERVLILWEASLALVVKNASIAQLVEHLSEE